jgi:hypothetical protein
MSGVITVTQPAEDVLTLDEIKAFLRIDFSEDDIFLISTLKMTQDFVEKYLNSSLVSRTLELALDRLPEYEMPLREGMYTGPYMSFVKDYISLPYSPVSSIVSIKTFDDADNETTVNQAVYILDSYRKPARVVLRNGQTWPNATREVNTVIIRYVAGYGGSTSVPEPIRLAMLQNIAFMYEHRGDAEKDKPSMPEQMQVLLGPYRMLGFSTSKLGV